MVKRLANLLLMLNLAMLMVNAVSGDFELVLVNLVGAMAAAFTVYVTRGE